MRAGGPSPGPSAGSPPRRRADDRRSAGRARPARQGPAIAALSAPKIGRPRLHLRTAGSTNERARELALAGAPHGTLVTADAQTAGRGRHGRAWTAPPGSSVLLSIVLRLSGEAAALLPLAAAVAVCEGCERSAGVTCAIKWPNDVWIDGRKAAGILVEGRPQEGWAVLGIGINVTLRARDLPHELRETATSLAEAGADGPKVETVLAAVTSSLDRWLDEEADAVLDAWRGRDALRGRPVRWPDGQGVAEGISAAGALLVRQEGARVELHAGEVALVRPVGED